MFNASKIPFHTYPIKCLSQSDMRIYGRPQFSSKSWFRSCVAQAFPPKVKNPGTNAMALENLSVTDMTQSNFSSLNISKPLKKLIVRV